MQPVLVQPTIYEVTDEHGQKQRTLVNRLSLSAWLGRESERKQTYPMAVDLGPLNPVEGVMRLAQPEPGRFVLIEPRPCLCVVYRPQGWTENKLMAQRLGKAAVVMLELAEDALNIQPTLRQGTTWEFGGPVKRGGNHGWDGFKFIAAYRFTRWKSLNMTTTAMATEMRGFGWTGSDAAMRQMLARLGLVTDRG
jgi:hypothetical protein